MGAIETEVGIFSGLMSAMMMSMLIWTILHGDGVSNGKSLRYGT
jgi:hypothetical protein